MSAEIPKQSIAYLICSLTREEFHCAFALAWMSLQPEFRDYVPIDQWPTPGCEGETHNWQELLLRAVRRFALEDRYEFEGLQPLADGRLFLRPPPIEPGNMAYVNQIVAGTLPMSPAHAMADLLATIERLNLKTPRTAVRRALRLHEEAELAAGHGHDPKELRKLARHTTRALATQGLRRIPTAQEIAS